MRVGTGRAPFFQVLDQRTVSARQALYLHLLESLGELAGYGQSILQQVPQARGRLKALANDPPVAIGTTREIKGGNMQMDATNGRHTVHGAQIAGMPMNQSGRQQALGKQLLGAVYVRHDALKQAHTLHNPCFNLMPTIRINN